MAASFVIMLVLATLQVITLGLLVLHAVRSRSRLDSFGDRFADRLSTQVRRLQYKGDGDGQQEHAPMWDKVAESMRKRGLI